MRLEETRTGEGANLRFHLVDDIDAAEREGVLGGCVLGLGFAKLGEGDEIAVSLNGRELPWNQREIPSQPWTQEVYDGAWNVHPSRTKNVPLDFDTVEFGVGPQQLNKGPNELIIRLVRRGSVGGASLVLQSVRISQLPALSPLYCSVQRRNTKATY